MIQLRKFFKAFYYAGRGIIDGLSERNVRFHVAATIVVMGLGWWLKISQTEWFAVLILIGAVLSLELVNTAIEDVANHMRDELHLGYSSTTRARDVAAGAVLVMAFFAAVVGVMIFIPKILVLQ